MRSYLFSTEKDVCICRCSNEFFLLFKPGKWRCAQKSKPNLGPPLKEYEHHIICWTRCLSILIWRPKTLLLLKLNWKDSYIRIDPVLDNIDSHPPKSSMAKLSSHTLKREASISSSVWASLSWYSTYIYIIRFFCSP